MTDKKTILFIHHGSSLGGAPLILLEYLKRMDKAVYKRIVVLPEEGPFADLLKKEGVEYRIIPLFTLYYCSQAKSFSAESPRVFAQSLRRAFILIKKAVFNILLLPAIIKKEDPQIVVITTSTPLLCGVIAKMMGRRVIWHIREVISTEKSRFLKKLISSIINFSSDKIIVMSRFSLIDISNLKINNAAVIYDGAVDLNKFSMRKKDDLKLKELGINASDKIVCFTGQICRQKGWHVLAGSAFIIAQKMPKIKFLIIGGSSMMEAGRGSREDPLREFREDAVFKRVTKRLGLAGNFIFLGQRMDVEDILPAVDCLAFPNIAPEVFGRVMVEAMACGVPVVASDIGAAPEIIIHNVTGLLVKPQDPKALSDALVYILTNEERAMAMGEAGRKRAEELFDAGKVYSDIRLFCF